MTRQTLELSPGDWNTSADQDRIRTSARHNAASEFQEKCKFCMLFFKMMTKKITEGVIHLFVFQST